MKIKLDAMAQTIPLDLAGFTWPELLLLANHLHYAADRLQQEMANWRQAGRKRYFYPRQATGKTEARPQGLMISHWAGLIRDHRYFTSLARAVEVVLDDRWDALFIPDRPLPALDLSGLLAGGKGNQHFFLFLNRELYRARLAVDYLQRETFDEQLKQDLLLALNVEIRFFNCLLEWLSPLIPVPLSVPGPEDDRVSLLFVSLPRVLATGYNPGRTPLPVENMIVGS